MATTYYLAIGIDPNTQTDPQSDGVHLDGEYGFAVDYGDGNGIQVLGPGSGGSGRQFEAVRFSPSGGANGSPLRIVLFDNFPSALTPGSSYIRAVFRPSHDTPPAPNVDTSPLAPNDTQSLLNGVALGARGSSVTATSAPTYGLPSNSYQHGVMLPAYTISGNNSASFEMTVEVTAAVSGSTYYYKIDPEMMIDF